MYCCITTTQAPSCIHGIESPSVIGEGFYSFTVAMLSFSALSGVF